VRCHNERRFSGSDTNLLRKNPAGGHAIHLRLLQQPRQEAMAIAAIGERRYRCLMPEGRIALRS